VGIDGIAASLVLLTGLLGPLVVLASWSFVQDKVKEFHLALLVLQTAMMGALCSLDLLLFYIFFEAMLIPMYLLIGVWGSEERQMAAMKFFLYTLVGSLLMLVALLGVYFIATPAGAHTFDYAGVYNGLLGAAREVSMCHGGATPCSPGPAALALLRYGPWMFAAFALAFAIKVPMWPLHTWLPDAHTQAPVAGSMILAAVMLKMGTFGFWRFAVPLFPAAAQQFQVPLAILAVIGIVYGALMCLAQRDIKRLIAYSSVSHLGYCMLGLAAMTPEAATGSAYQMLNHGVSTGALFLLFGMLYERRHVRNISDYGGIAKVMPVFTAFFVIITFSSVAVPGTNGFIGEFLVLLGTFNSGLPLWLGVLASLGVVLGAAYMLLMVQKVFFGTVTRKENQNLQDLNLREIATALPFVVLVLQVLVLFARHRAEEHLLHHQQHVRGAEHHAERRENSEPQRQARVEGAEQHQELADEAVRARHRDRRERDDDEERGEHRHHLRDAAVVADVPHVAALVEHAEQQEERAGRHAVVQHLVRRARRRLGRHRREPEHAVAQVAHRRVRDEPLDVALREAHQRAVHDADDR